MFHVRGIVMIRDFFVEYEFFEPDMNWMLCVQGPRRLADLQLKLPTWKIQKILFITLETELV